MDLTDIRKLVRLMIRAELSELEIDDTQKGMRVHLKRDSRSGSEASLPSFVQMMPPAMATPQAEPLRGSEGGLELDESELPAGTEVFASPMVGTFYRASSPDAEPFVTPGQKFTEDSVLCIVEAMKVMNEIKAESRGEIVEILVENGEPVEFGQPLLLVKKG
ncbi:MAG: acetyl-CoA carboxylase, biotin carboxyl carrier protein [Planctomycetes bacterium]|nr:acetyl-CoA carboxylase, biotin carboxyl carrier protein [Planctomycetota bacterium]